MKRLEELGDFSLLCIEDDIFNQELASATFEDTANIKIYQASDGKKGLEFLQNHDVDIILLDLMMPNMNGKEFLKKVKGSSETKFVPIIVLTSKSEEKTATYKLGADDFLSKPFNPEELKLRVFNHLRVKRFYDLMGTIEANEKRDGNIDNIFYLKEALDLIDNSQKQLLVKLGSLAHEHGYHNKNTSKRLGEYAKLLGNLYGLNSVKSDNLYYSMSICDIGLLRIPKEQLLSEDSKTFKRHTELGLEVLNDIKETALISMAKSVILHHHENWDGTGYPNRLKGNDIPIYAQIAGLVDFFDKLTVPRVYTKGIKSTDDALSYMKGDSGLRFNPELLDIFIKNYSKFLEIKDRLG